jgi:hypothetical protein
LTGVTVKVTEAPWQMLELFAMIETDGATTGLTVMVTAFDVTFACVTQLKEDVSTQLTTSPLFRLDEE